MEFDFSKFDLGTCKPTSIPTEVVDVCFGPKSLVGEYSSAFIDEAWRVNPLRMEQIGLTREEMENYTNFLLYSRVEQVHLRLRGVSRYRVFYIPVFIQYVLTCIGRVDIYNEGLILLPHMPEDFKPISFEDALKISQKVSMLKDDLQIVDNALPRDIYGDKDVMSTALIADYVRSLHEVRHVASTYVSAFLGANLVNEVAFRVLYRVQYDDYKYIQSALTTFRGLF